MHSCQVLPDDVELDVDNRAGLDGVEIRVVEGVGNDADLESVFRGAANGKAHAIDCHAALIDGEVAVLDHFLCALVLERVLMAALLVFDGDADSRLVNVSLHDMSVKAAIHQHRAFHIHLIAHFQEAEVAALQCLSHSGDSIGVTLKAYYGEADTVVGYALVDAQLLDEGAS